MPHQQVWEGFEYKIKQDEDSHICIRIELVFFRGGATRLIILVGNDVEGESYVRRCT